MNTNNIPPYAPQTPPPFVPPAPARQTKNKFWTVFWSFIPGAGQMYHGLMKRGISLMACLPASLRSPRSPISRR